MARESSGPKSEGGVLRYGPSILWWGMLLVALVIVVAPPLLVFLLPRQAPTTTESVFIWAFWLLAVGGLVVACPRSWTRFDVRREGLEQHTVGGRRFRTWSELEGISTEQMDFDASQDPDQLGFGGRGFSLPVQASMDGSAFYFVIHDTDGGQAFRIPPWVSHRRHLIREIRHRLRTRGRR